MNAVVIATRKDGKFSVHMSETCLGAIDKLYAAVDSVSGDVSLIVKVELFTKFTIVDSADSFVYGKLQERNLHTALA